MEELREFLDRSVSAYHATANLVEMLEKAGYTRLYEHEPWNLVRGGK